MRLIGAIVVVLVILGLVTGRLSVPGIGLNNSPAQRVEAALKDAKGADANMTAIKLHDKGVDDKLVKAVLAARANGMSDDDIVTKLKAADSNNVDKLVVALGSPSPSTAGNTGGSSGSSGNSGSVAAPSGSGGGSFTAAQKCDWLKSNFPQSTEGVQSYGAKLANVPAQRVRTHIFPCDTKTSVFDGLIVLGPNEGFAGEVSVTMPSIGGALDAYDTACGAKYSETPVLINSMPNKCDSTWRVTGGSANVKALSLTYWPWNDDKPPVGAAATSSSGKDSSASAPAPASTGGSGDCKLGKDLASEKGWPLVGSQASSITDFGGARVTVPNGATLPAGWAALSSGRKIEPNATDRSMVGGDWSIYPPEGACRTQLGVSK